jgi:hypothetical protein
MEGLSYASTLDPWLRLSERQVDGALKLALLTCRQVVISDNQAVNNAGLQRLLRRPDVRSFLSAPEPDGGFPLGIALRHEDRSFDDVVSRLVLRSSAPAVLPWMTGKQQARLDAIYGGPGRAKTTGPLYDLAGPSFTGHIEFLDTYAERGETAVTRWDGLEESYPRLVGEAIARFRTSLAAEPGEAARAALQACDSLQRALEASAEANRSNLFRALAGFGLPPHLRRILQLKLLGEPYHLNFARERNLHVLTGSEYGEAALPKVLPRLAGLVKDLRPEEFLEFDRFPVHLEQLPYARIGAIRASYSFKRLVGAITGGPETERLGALKDLLNLISAESQRDPKGVAKLGRLRIKVLFPPTHLRDALKEAGVSLGDFVALASRLGGFLTGEYVGQLVGVFGLGGLAGTTAAITIERLVDETVTLPRMRREFQDLVHLLAQQAAGPLERRETKNCTGSEEDRHGPSRDGSRTLSALSSGTP